MGFSVATGRGHHEESVLACRGSYDYVVCVGHSRITLAPHGDDLGRYGRATVRWSWRPGRRNLRKWCLGGRGRTTSVAMVVYARHHGVRVDRLRNGDGASSCSLGGEFSGQIGAVGVT